MAFLQIQGLSKSFPGVRALDDVDLDAEQGEVHALIGANGAGKSTLMNVLSGALSPDGGTVRLGGKPMTFGSPPAAQKQGVATVFQEFSSIPELTVAQNIFLGREPVNKFGFIDRRLLLARCRALLERYHLPLDLDAALGELSVAQQQLVEIARALSQPARILILDEPTAVLAGNEQDNLFRIIETLKSAGLLILYVSHRMEEIFAIADRVTVLRGGKKVATVAVADIEQAELVRMMIGHHVKEAAALPAVPANSPTVLGVTFGDDGLSSFSLKGGEIVGMAGLVGAGRSELAKKLIGIGNTSGLTVSLAGRAVRIRSPREAMRLGIVYLTEDRKRDGLFSNRSILNNATAASLSRVSRWGFIDGKKERRTGKNVLERLRLISRSLDGPVRELSGGNQQKVIIGRAILCAPKVLICDEPTRGIDVGAKEEFYRILIDLAAQGVGIIFISSELKELLLTTHRLVVVRDGRIVAEMATAGAREEQVLSAATGASA